MVRGLYTAWTGMYNEQKRLDVIANNIANSATTGYKQEGVTSQSFDNVLAIKVKDYSVDKNEVIGSMTLGVKVGEIYTNHKTLPSKTLEEAFVICTVFKDPIQSSGPSIITFLL